MSIDSDPNRVFCNTDFPLSMCVREYVYVPACTHVHIHAIPILYKRENLRSDMPLRAQEKNLEYKC